MPLGAGHSKGNAVLLQLPGGAALALAGALLFYISGSHQRLVPAFGSKVAARSSGLLLLIVSALLLSRALSTTAAVFIVCMIVMATWSLLPLLFAWLRRERPAK